MISARALEIGERVERFVRDVVIPYETDPRRDHHGAPLDELVYEMRDKARAAGVLTPWAASSQGAWAQSPWKGYYATGMKQRAVRFAAGDGATLAGTLLLPRCRSEPAA